ncbi:Dirigent protein 24 [Raphanus sativus]|uniref:Dirigent protein n=1 Tax=Raphanus sativus TaxID=3726 RepID=A0A6J0N9B5_RAPSA|nr:dirigent protein 24 [Raphanus sativus]KAJ4904694.1 Dirigent protein 24 [Raphanus sativus]
MAKAFSLTILTFLLISSNVYSARLLDEVQPQTQLVPVIPAEEDEDPPVVTTQSPIPNPLPGPATGGHVPVLEFFMHDVLGGSHPSARVVTGIVAQTEVNGIPFSKSNNNIFPVDNAVPLVNANDINNIINPNTAPLLTGLSGSQANTVIQNTNGNSQGSLSSNNLPFVTAGQLPPAAALQQLMFGTITVVDDELTEGHELGSAIIGRAQGFYIASSLDGTSQTLSLTVLFHGEHDHHDTLDDAISFFGVHRTASHASHIAVVGGTGKFEHAKGYAVVETLHNQEDQHVTDGRDTILHFSIYLTYYKLEE